jgi:hypothetical protein
MDRIGASKKVFWNLWIEIEIGKMTKIIGTYG